MRVIYRLSFQYNSKWLYSITELFSGFLFATAKVVSRTAMILFHIIDFFFIIINNVGASYYSMYFGLRNQANQAIVSEFSRSP